MCNAPSTPCETFTSGGNANGATCQFPFIYKDVLYYQCTGADHKGKQWCATTYNYDLDEKWGNCAGTEISLLNNTKVDSEKYHVQTRAASRAVL